MKKYIKIANKSGNVSRIALEKLGLSTKRDDPNTIGQFGSGIKYAPIAALRMGLEWIFTGTDDKGSYVLRYKVEKEDGVDCIVYDYGDYQKSSSFTIDAGVLSWEDCFQIYREAIANAMDEANENDTKWYREIVEASEVKQNYGEFAVYISASPNMMEIYDEHDKYFLENREPIHEGKDGYAKVNFFDPYSSSEGHVYHKSVMVYENTEHDCLFDYEVKSLRLNEMRTVSDEWQMNYLIAHGIAECSNNKIIERILDNLGSKKWEYKLSDSIIGTADIADEWRKVWGKKYGEATIMLNSIEDANNSIHMYLKEKGQKYKTVDSSFIYTILTKSGVNTLESIAGESINYDIDFDTDKYPKLLKAIEIAARYEPGISVMERPIACFTPKQSDTFLGLLINKDNEEKRILIEKNHARDGEIYEIVATIIHEYDHYTTGYADGDHAGRKFRDLADRRIGRLMCENYKPDLLSTCADGISIPLSSISDLGGLNYNILYFMDSYILSIGKCKFIISQKQLSDSEIKYNDTGVMKPSVDGQSMLIPFENWNHNNFYINQI